METRNLIFALAPEEMMRTEHATATHHLLCHRGNVKLTVNNVCYNIVSGDYAILPGVPILSNITRSDDYEGDLMILSESFVRLLRPHNNYHVFGHLSLLRNPIMHLAENDFRTCSEDIAFIRRRIEMKAHLFFDEMLEHLVMTHVLNIYDIHARQMRPAELPKRASEILRQFINLLDDGHYRKNRELQFYADKLCITPHYLSEVCKTVTGQPATYWIDLYLGNEVLSMMTATDRTLSDIAYELNFSSLSYFTRYARKLIGMSPTKFRKNSKEKFS